FAGNRESQQARAHSNPKSACELFEFARYRTRRKVAIGILLKPPLLIEITLVKKSKIGKSTEDGR
ncbi:MAG: hypothetical protein WAK21_08685, partial [Candidatus Sulfotelmatobacter sp.]